MCTCVCLLLHALTDIYIPGLYIENKVYLGVDGIISCVNFVENALFKSSNNIN